MPGYSKTMRTGFELFVAKRYLRARRKEAVISVITVISVIGVAAGVMALVIALGVNNGFRATLQRNLLGAMAHINVIPKQPGDGIDGYQQMAEQLRKLPHVTGVSPALYDGVYLVGPLQHTGAELKGVNVNDELTISPALRRLQSGSLDRLRDPNAKPPGIVLGADLATDTGMVVNSIIKVVSPTGELTPTGPWPAIRQFRVVGIFKSGFYDVDDHLAFTSIESEQRIESLPNQVNQMEINVDDLNRAPKIAREIEKVVGQRYTTTTWLEQNQKLLSALNMERVVTIITIGLIELVAALNIFITLVMMVMEKYRDIGVLMSMGARRAQIRGIFMLQGVLIGIVGSVIGLAVGYTLCYYGNRYRLVPLDPAVYSMSFVPFNPRWVDAIWIAGAAILVSFLATIYPARSATRIAPVDVLRYE